MIKCLSFSEISGSSIIKDFHVMKHLGLTLKNSLCCVTLVCVCVCEQEQGPLRALMTADDRLRRAALWLMKAAATLMQWEGVRLWPGGPQRTRDNANDTAISPFNTCLANTLTMRVAAKKKMHQNQILKSLKLISY